MPFRGAYLFLLALVPMVGIAFWPGYFGQIRSAPFALHVHGLSAVAWLILVELQAWSASGNRLAWHRQLGLAMFIAVPAFVAGGLLAMQSMAVLAAAKADPFHADYGALLALDDAVAVIAFLALVVIAVGQRRRVWVHGAAMIGTVLLVLPPIITRLPGFPASASFTAIFLFAQGCALAMAVLLLVIYRRSRLPFGFAAATIALQTLVVQTFGRSAAWERLCFDLTSVSPTVLALLGAMLGFVPLLLIWLRGQPARRRSSTAKAAASRG